MSPRWLRCRTPRAAARTRLVCFPHAGGSASFFGTWGAGLPQDVELWAVQFPGREDRIADAVPASMAEVVAGVLADLGPLLDRPLALFGHSMGAVAAYEVARALEARGEAPTRVFASARHAPDELVGGDIHLRDDAGLVEEVVRVGGAGAEVLKANPELWPVFLPAIRADYRVEETYRHLAGAPLRAPITAVVGEDDSEVTPAQAERWSDFTTGGFDLRVVPGDHFYPVRHNAMLLDLLTCQLNEVKDVLR
ncbi:alpha/beta fold hydrolase [Allokutzneria multivorans]|uniref:Alpha/beta fold hydrolase n=1 Tax=Allokutzneria multivorans TaxID=1142134 RepID=A0ABP7RZR7_9PSEU